MSCPGIQGMMKGLKEHIVEGTINVEKKRKRESSAEHGAFQLIDDGMQRAFDGASRSKGMLVLGERRVPKLNLQETPQHEPLQQLEKEGRQADGAEGIG
jgi:hypothetical protein